MASCFKCGHPLPSRERIFRSTLCEECGAEAHVCLNCDFYQPGAHWDCRETIPEAVREKDRANFCDYFRPRTAPSETADPSHASPDTSRDDNARDKFNSLFGDS